MRELSLHLLDIIQNSISAEANLIEVLINEDLSGNILTLQVKDNGRGMPEDQVVKTTDPFVTSRKTREVGLGIPLLKRAAEECNGKLEIASTIGQGTGVRAVFQYDHIDRAPLGDIVSTLLGLISLNPEIDFLYQHQVGHKGFSFDTREIKKELGELKIGQAEIRQWLKDFLRENIQELYGGEDDYEIT